LISEDIYHQIHQEHYFFVAHLARKLVGYINIRIINQTLHINYVAVDPRYQGQGIGTSLLTHAIDSRKYQQIDKLTLDVDLANTIAFSWYEKLGFKVRACSYIYCEAIDQFRQKACSFDVVNWLDAEAWQSKFGFSNFNLKLDNNQEYFVGRLGENYWRIIKVEDLEIPELVYTLKILNGERRYLLFSSFNRDSLRNIQPKRVAFRMEKALLS
jgi:ribosomal protein S18 acetylase RimI-like enzyme